MLKNCQKWGYFVQVIVDISTCFLYISLLIVLTRPAISHCSLFFFLYPDMSRVIKECSLSRTKHHPCLSFERLSHFLLHSLVGRSLFIGISKRPRSRRNRRILFLNTSITNELYFDFLQKACFRCIQKLEMEIQNETCLMSTSLMKMQISGKFLSTVVGHKL